MSVEFVQVAGMQLAPLITKHVEAGPRISVVRKLGSKMLIGSVRSKKWGLACDVRLEWRSAAIQSGTMRRTLEEPAVVPEFTNDFTALIAIGQKSLSVLARNSDEYAFTF